MSITRAYCPVNPSGFHRWREEARIVHVLHPRCEDCGFIDTLRDLVKEREREAWMMADRIAETAAGAGSSLLEEASKEKDGNYWTEQD